MGQANVHVVFIEGIRLPDSAVRLLVRSHIIPDSLAAAEVAILVNPDLRRVKELTEQGRTVTVLFKRRKGDNTPFDRLAEQYEMAGAKIVAKFPAPYGNGGLGNALAMFFERYVVPTLPKTQ